MSAVNKYPSQVMYKTVMFGTNLARQFTLQSVESPQGILKLCPVLAHNLTTCSKGGS